MLGASQGDFERFIVAPTSCLDAFNTVAELFNLCDRAQCPGILISDLLISEGTYSVDPGAIDMQPKIDRGALIQDPSPNGNYLRYAITDSGISPRVVPGYEGFVHTVATDEHDEDGVLISDEYTHPHKRRRMVEKRARKFAGVAADVPAPKIEGSAEADVTLVGWGSSYGVIHEAIERLAEEGVVANHLPIKWIVPFHGDEVKKILESAKKVVIVENNHSGQFARYMRSETGFTAAAHIRKYDGEPFMPHHVVEGVQEIVKSGTEIYVPYQEMIV